MITKIDALPGYVEVIEDTPITITVPSTARSVFQNIAPKWVTAYIVRVRSMGTATYIALGNYIGQEYRLTAVGEYRACEARPGEVLDITKLWIVSDTSDAVVELVCSFIPARPKGNVTQVEDTGVTK